MITKEVGENLFKRIIVITGTPGVGKTAVSKRVAAELDARVIHLGELIRKEKLYSEVDEERDTLVADVEKVSERVKEIIDESCRDVIVEGHFAVDVIPPNVISKVFVLRRHPEDLKIILEKRGYRERKVWENVAAEILDVCLYEAVRVCGVEKVCEIDVTNRGIDKIVSEILSILNGQGNCKIGKVDWLGRLEAEGKLDEYLRHF